MLLAYLEDIKKHASLIAFMAFAGWLGFLALLQMAFGWGGVGENTPIPPSPDAVVASSVGQPSEPSNTADGTEGRCLNIEGLIVCEGA